MSDVIEKYVCHVIFEENEVGVLPRWASCPTLPYCFLTGTLHQYHIILLLQIHFMKLTNSRED